MRAVSLRWLLGSALGMALVLGACSRKPAQQPFSRSVSLDGFQTTATVVEEDANRTAACTAYGKASDVRYTYTLFTTTDGAQDVLFMPGHAVGGGTSPSAWNRDLVLYAHGFIDPNDTTAFTDYVAQPDFADTRDRMLCEGFALAASSFAAKGYAVKEGIEDTHLLNAVFAAYYETPDRAYVVGSSMGGLITVALAEQFQARYAGAMPTCGPIGGSLLEFNYIGNARILFDHYLPQPDGSSYLGGDLLHPADPPPSNLANLVFAAVSAHPTGFASLENTWLDITSLGNITLPSTLTMPAVQSPQAFGLSATDLGVPSTLMPFIVEYALGRALRYHVVGAKDLLERMGGSPFDNTATTYTDLTDATPTAKSWLVLTGSAPYAPDAVAVARAMEYYQPTGDTSVPLLTMHTYIDPDVPLHHEYVYAALAAMHHGTDLKSYAVVGIVTDDLRALVAQIDPTVTLPSTSPFGHCNFATSDLVAGLGILVRHVEQGAPWPTSAAEGLPASFGPLPALPAP